MLTVGHSMLTLGKETQVGLNAMLRRYANRAQNELKEVVKAEWTRDPIYWTRRPLSDQMTRYAHLDVAFLLKAFDSMAAELERKSLLNNAINRSRLYLDHRRRSPVAAPAAAAAQASDLPGTDPMSSIPTWW
jgi:ribonuclease D